jgi:hypothetical protein
MTRFFIKHCDTTNNSLTGSADTRGVAVGLTTGLDLENPPVHYLRGQGAQTGLTLKTRHTYQYYCQRGI